MITKIRKRDGSTANFKKEKIAQAIWQAAQAVGRANKDLSRKLANDVTGLLEERLDEDEIPTVEETQDVVEKVLVKNGHYKIAKAYILYRSQHEDIRMFHQLSRDIYIIEDYLSGKDWKVKENSNMSYSLQGLNVHITNKVVSNYWLGKLYPPEIRENHTSGFYHIHDLGILGAYCVGWDLQDLLTVGIKGARGKIESKPAKHFDVALLQLVNFLYTMQGEAAGAQAVSNFDTLLAPFIYYDHLSYQEVK